VVLVRVIKDGMEHWWNDTDSERKKYSNIPFQGYVIYKKSHVVWPGIELETLR
jgi:hypothetical protein